MSEQHTKFLYNIETTEGGRGSIYYSSDDLFVSPVKLRRFFCLLQISSFIKQEFASLILPENKAEAISSFSKKILKEADKLSFKNSNL